jgi:hypothetical protein
MTNESNKMSAEEIREKWDIEYVSEELREYYSNNVVGAMEEYASQQTQSLQKQIEDLHIENQKRYEVNWEYLEKINELKDQLSQKDEMLERMAHILSESKYNIEIELVSHSLKKRIEVILTQYQNSKK